MSELKEYQLIINRLDGVYKSKIYNGETLLGIALQDFWDSIKNNPPNGRIVFINDIVLGYDIPATEKLKDIKIDLTKLLSTVAILGILQGKNRFGLLDHVLVMFHSNLKWPPFTPNEDDPISYKPLGEIDSKDIKTIKDLNILKYSHENTNAPNLLVLEFPDSKNQNINRIVVHKKTYIESLVVTKGKCPITQIQLSSKFRIHFVNTLKDPLPIINIVSNELKLDYVNAIKLNKLDYLM